MFQEKRMRFDFLPGKVAFVCFSDDVCLTEKIGIEINRKFYLCTHIPDQKYKVVNEGGEIEYFDDAIIVLLHEEKIDKYTPSDLAHESLHVANRIFERIGYEPKADNDEIQAYLMGYIFDNLYDFTVDCVKELDKKDVTLEKEDNE